MFRRLWSIKYFISRRWLSEASNNTKGTNEYTINFFFDIDILDAYIQRTVVILVTFDLVVDRIDRNEYINCS